MCSSDLDKNKLIFALKPLWHNAIRISAFRAPNIPNSKLKERPDSCHDMKKVSECASGFNLKICFIMLPNPTLILQINLLDKQRQVQCGLADNH